MEDEIRSLPQSGGNDVTSDFSHWFSLALWIFVYRYLRLCYGDFCRIELGNLDGVWEPLCSNCFLT